MNTKAIDIGLNPHAVVDEAVIIARDTGARSMLTADVDQAVIGIDHACTDVWLSMGEDKEIHDKFGLESMEVTDAVFESPASIVFDQAENRMHTIKAMLVATPGA